MLLFAGHETTIGAIDRGVLLFSSNPEQRAALRSDPDLVEVAVEEVLRHGLPRRTEETQTGLPRFTRADIEIDETTIPAGDLLLLDLRDANQTEALFPEPASFDITRSPNPHVTFGHGPHFCIGAPLARIELQSLFGVLYQRFPDLRLAVPIDEVPTRPEMLSGGIEALPVTW